MSAALSPVGRCTEQLDPLTEGSPSHWCELLAGHPSSHQEGQTYWTLRVVPTAPPASRASSVAGLAALRVGAAQSMAYAAALRHQQRPPAQVTQPPLPEVVETRTEWGVRYADRIVTEHGLGDDNPQHRRTEEEARDVVSLFSEETSLVSRTVQVGPWVEVAP